MSFTLRNTRKGREPKRKLYGKRENTIKTNEKQIEKIATFDNSKFCIVKSFNPKKLAPSNAGIDNKKDIFAESNLLKFNILAAVIDIPDLLTPGIKDNI